MFEACSELVYKTARASAIANHWQKIWRRNALLLRTALERDSLEALPAYAERPLVVRIDVHGIARLGVNVARAAVRPLPGLGSCAAQRVCATTFGGTTRSPARELGFLSHLQERSEGFGVVPHRGHERQQAAVSAEGCRDESTPDPRQRALAAIRTLPARGEWTKAPVFSTTACGSTSKAICAAWKGGR
jgi:hypothetical protein